MLSRINIDSSIPVYEQIENQVQFAIASGELKIGDKLPSVKELADRLDINFNTVAKAYRDLEVMGLISTHRGRGCFVKKGAEKQCRDMSRSRVAARLFEAVQEGKAAGLGKKNVTELVNASFATDAEPYGDVPSEIKNLLKR